MFGFIKKLFGAKPAEVTAEVPYKVETPVAKVETVNSQPVVKEAAPAVEVKAAPKAPAKKAAAKKTQAPKAPAKKPAPAKAPAKRGPKKAK